MFRNSLLLSRLQNLTKPSAEPRASVLVADSQEPEATSLRVILERHNFHVLQAHDGTRALESARRTHPKLVIAAMDLPGINGYELCKKIREEGSSKSVPILFISSPGEVPDKLVGHATFASDYIQRPINLGEFENRLKAILRSVPTPHLHIAQSPTPQGQDSHQTASLAVAEPPRRESPSGFSDLDIESLLIEEDVEETKEPANASSDQSGDSVDTAKSHLLPKPAEKSSPSPMEDQWEGSAFPLGSEALAEDLGSRYIQREEVGKETALLYKEAFAYVLSAIRRAENHRAMDLPTGLGLSRRILMALKSDNGLLLLATDRTAEFSLTQHCVNTAIIATRISHTMGMSEEHVLRLCLAGLLHDIGTVRLPPKLLCKFSAFTEEERLEMRKRPFYSGEILSGIPDFEWLPPIVSRVPEREDIRSLSREWQSESDLTEESMVLGLANVFEAAIHHRPYRRAMTGYQSLEALAGEVGLFPTRITKAMLRSFSVYFFNEFVVLNTGEIGKVININVENALRPTVKVLFSADGERLVKPKVVNLARNASLFITRAIKPEELPGPER